MSSHRATITSSRASARVTHGATTRPHSPTTVAAYAAGPEPTSNSQNFAVPPGRSDTYRGSRTSAADPHHAIDAPTVVTIPLGSASTWYAISRQRSSDFTRSTRRRQGVRATSGGTASVSRSPSRASTRDRSTADMTRAVTNSSQTNGSARGNVMSSATDVTASTTVTVNITVPITRSMKTCASDHHVDASRHGRRTSLITVTP